MYKLKSVAQILDIFHIDPGVMKHYCSCKQMDKKHSMLYVAIREVFEK